MWVAEREMQMETGFFSLSPRFPPLYPLQASPATSPLAKRTRCLAGKFSYLARKLSPLAA